MGRPPFFVLLQCHAVLVAMAVAAAALSPDDFPPGFIFGAGSSAYQVEGAAAEDGRKPSIWDTFTHAGYGLDKSTGDVASDQYHKYKDDVKLMHETGLDAYRFSIAWPRLIPDGRGAVNPKGLEYYNNLIDELTSHGIQPHATIYHFDLPQALQDEYNGLLSPKFIEDFTAYADVCFKEFGDRVKHWVTFNEPNMEPLGGYDMGIFPPQRCSYPFGVNCSVGDSTTEPYIVAHHLLLAHASAASLYRDKYQLKQGGKIGISLLAMWYEPYTQSSQDIAAAKRMIDFHIGWIMEPLVYGSYPAVMKKNAGSRLPQLSAEESRKVQGSFDFVGLNHYMVNYVQADLSQLNKKERDYMADTAIKEAGYGDVTPATPAMALSLSTHTHTHGLFRTRKGLLPSTPWALQRLLEYIKVNYGNPPIMIHENGVPEKAGNLTPGNGYTDDYRSNFLQDYVNSTLLAIRNGSNTQGYFVWSFLDCWEFLSGYSLRFGLYGVDFKDDNRTRYPKPAARWYSDFLRGNGLGTMATGRADTA